MGAASINQDIMNEQPNPEVPLRVSVQTTVQNDELTPPAGWIVEVTQAGEDQ